MTLPVWRAVLSVPEATPDRERSTLPSSDAVMTGTISPSPNPSAVSWATNVAKALCAPDALQRQRSTGHEQRSAGDDGPCAQPLLQVAGHRVRGHDRHRHRREGQPACSAEKCWARWKNRLNTKISP